MTLTSFNIYFNSDKPISSAVFYVQSFLKHFCSLYLLMESHTFCDQNCVKFRYNVHVPTILKYLQLPYFMVNSESMHIPPLFPDLE